MKIAVVGTGYIGLYKKFISYKLKIYKIKKIERKCKMLYIYSFYKVKL